MLFFPVEPAFGSGDCIVKILEFASVFLALYEIIVILKGTQLMILKPFLNPCMEKVFLLLSPYKSKFFENQFTEKIEFLFRGLSDIKRFDCQ
jgi:hypothetical protein